MANDEGATADDVSRRDALKKIGIGAGIAWSAPVVLSFYNAAGAATGTPESPTTPSTIPPTHPECVGSTCANVVPCSSSNADCGCVQTSNPEFTLCVPGSTPCSIGPACAPGDLSCPPGYFCAIDTCCGEPVCAPFSIAASCPPDPPTVQGQVAPRRQRVATGKTFFN